MWIDQPPASCHPLVEDDRGKLAVDPDRTVLVFPLRADLVDEFAAWTGGEVLVVNGGQAVIFDGQVAGLGDYAVRDADDHGELVGPARREQAAGFDQRYQLDSTNRET